MTTKPSDMKPSERIRELAEGNERHPFLIGNGSKIDAIVAYLDERHAAEQGEPVPMVLPCPGCHSPHVDEGEWATKPHRTHQCQHCKTEWRPASGATVGVAALPTAPVAAPPAQPEQGLIAYVRHDDGSRTPITPKQWAQAVLANPKPAEEAKAPPAQPVAAEPMSAEAAWNDLPESISGKLAKPSFVAGYNHRGVVEAMSRQWAPEPAALVARESKAAHVTCQCVDCMPWWPRATTEVARSALAQVEKLKGAVALREKETAQQHGLYREYRAQTEGNHCALTAANTRIAELKTALERAHDANQALRSTPEVKRLQGELNSKQIHYAQVLMQLKRLEDSNAQLHRENDAALARVAELEAERPHLIEGCEYAAQELAGRAVMPKQDRWRIAERKRVVAQRERAAEPSPVATGGRPNPAPQMWFYAPSRDSENWEGPHDTIDDALEAARSDYAGSFESFWVDEAHPVNWDRVKRSFLDADDMLDRFAEYVGDNEHIEDPEPEFKVSKAAAQEALERWAVEHLSMRDYWQCIGKAVVYPVVPPPTPATGGEVEP